MKIDGSGPTSIHLRLSRRDLVFLNDILNEVCHGFKVPEFTNRIGISREAALLLLRVVHDLAESMPSDEGKSAERTGVAGGEAVVEATRGQLAAIKNALRETLRELGVEEFDTRVGVSFEKGQAVLARFEEFLRVADQSK